MNRPLAIDLFTGLHGWAAELAKEGWYVVGFDLEDMCAKFGEQRPEHVRLVIQDVLTLHGKQFKDAALIVASPPCQAYSYRAMPWSRAKALPPPDNNLFEACFRIQREASEAAGRHISLIVENVRGAEKWVGRARWNFGSFYLWGDVPALMPMRGKDGVKVPGINFNDRGVSFNMTAVARYRTEKGNGERFASRKGESRKAAAAHIAKIPEPLSRYIARVFKQAEEHSHEIQRIVREMG